MKKIFVLLAVSAAGMLTSCNKLDNILDKNPLDDLTPESFYSTVAGLQAASNVFYNNFPGSELYIDNADTYFQMEQMEEIRGGRFVPESGEGWSWGALRNINTLLDYAYLCENEEERIKYMSIARFFRAYFYFEKVKRYGDVPWVDTQLGSADPELYKPRDPRELVIQNILKDLDYAIEHLTSSREVYTVTKWTALALKSRICLFEGTFRKYHDEFDYGTDAKDWKWYLNLCVEASDDFIINSGYTIYNESGTSRSYLDLFTQQTIASAEALNVKSEVVLARNYNGEYSAVHNSNYTFNVPSYGRYGMSKKMVASYLMKDGSRFTDKSGWQTMTFAQECQNRDPRLAMSIRTPGYTRLESSEKVAPNLAHTITGYQPIKYVTTPNHDSVNSSDNDLIIFRAAEVYLNYAEAKAELGTLVQADVDKSIKKLRDRVGMPNLILNGLTPDPFLTNLEWGGYQNVKGENVAAILEVRRERTIELAQEGFRYYDLMRWKEGAILTQPMYGMYFPGPGEYNIDNNGVIDVCLWSGSKPSTTATNIFELDKDIILSEGTKGFIFPFKKFPATWDEGRDYLYPIPSGERLLSNMAYTQNPGWDDGLDN